MIPVIMKINIQKKDKKDREGLEVPRVLMYVTALLRFIY